MVGNRFRSRLLCLGQECPPLRCAYRYLGLLAGLLLVVSACGDGEPTAWDRAMTAHSDLAQPASRLANDEGYLIEQYNEEYDAWRSVDDCDALNQSSLDTWDLLQQNARDTIAENQDGVDGELSQAHDEYLARMTAIGVISRDLGCTSLDAGNTTISSGADKGPATTLVVDQESYVQALRDGSDAYRQDTSAAEGTQTFIDERTDKELVDLGLMVCRSFDDNKVGSVTDITDVIEEEVDAGLEGVSLVVHVLGTSVYLLCPAHLETFENLVGDDS